MIRVVSLVFASALLSSCSSMDGQAGSVGLTDLKQRVLNAIQGGQSLTTLEIFHPNYQHVEAEVAALAGCDYEVYDPPFRSELHVDWTCDEQERSRFTRIYLPDGRLSRFEIQPSIAKMKPTEIALRTQELPSRKAINDEFQKAVVAGDDPTLDGLIPITPEHLQILSDMEGWTVFRDEDDARYGAEALWLDKPTNSSVGADTTIHFDEDGRPIGLWIRISQILRRTITTTTKL